MSIQARVALIGMAGKFANSENLSEFWMNVDSGKDCVRPFPSSRIAELEMMGVGHDPSTFIEGGYLNTILDFEPGIFGIPAEEARFIDPQQRLLLELVEQCILDAGYNPESLSGDRIGVYVAESPNSYTPAIVETSVMSEINSVTSLSASRIAYVYNFAGPALTIGTACSSALVALHQACISLNAKEIDYAVVAAARLFIIPPSYQELTGSPLGSKQQRIRPFDALADGIIGGEGGGAVLLRRFDDSATSSDNIHAIIRSSAVNNNGATSNGINAPSEGSQAKVITSAIRQAGIDPNHLAYIETHGSGTQIGDPIEFNALRSALQSVGYCSSKVPIGSVKSNIGHLDVASGMAGLLKAVLCLKNGRIPPTINHSQPNDQIDFANSDLYVNSSACTMHDFTKRFAGVTSLGLTGTNVHVILERAENCIQATSKPAALEPYIVALSSRTRISLRGLISQTVDYLARHPDVSIANVAFTLNSGRRNLPCSVALLATSIPDLVVKLKGESWSYRESIATHRIGFIIDDLSNFDNRIYNINLRHNSSLRKCLDDLSDTFNRQDIGADLIGQYILFEIGLAKLLQGYGITADAYVGIGTGEIISQYLSGQIDLDTCFKLVSIQAQSRRFVDKGQLPDLAQQLKIHGITGLVYLSGRSEVGTTLYDAFQTAGIFLVQYGAPDDLKGYTSLLKLFELGVNVNWAEATALSSPLHISLPTYCFDRLPYFKELFALEEKPARARSAPAIREGIIDLIRDLCDNQWDYGDKIGNLGINSLQIIHLLNTIENSFGIRPNLELFFRDDTIGELIDNIELSIGASNNHYAARPRDVQNSSSLVEHEDVGYFPASYQQMRIYAADQLSANGSYAMMFAVKMTGYVNVDELQCVLNKLVSRHELLRTTFSLRDGKLLQVVNRPFGVDIDRHSYSGGDVFGELERLHQFNLLEGPLFAITLFHGEQESILIWRAHHIIADGISMGIIYRELADLFCGKQLEEPRVRYRDFVLWQEQQLMESSLLGAQRFWMNLLEGPLRKLSFPKSRFSQAGKHLVHKELGTQVVRSLRRLSEETGATMFVLLLTVYTITLSKFTNKKDVLVLTFSSGRDKGQWDDVVGAFVNDLLLPFDVSDDLEIHEHIRNVKDTVIKALEHQHLPLETVLRAQGLLNRTGLNGAGISAFQVLNNYALEAQAWEHKVRFDIIPTDGNMGDFGLLFRLVEVDEDTMRAEVTYDTEYYAQDDIEEFVHGYERILNEVVNDISVTISDLNVKDYDKLRHNMFSETIDFGMNK